MKRIHASKCPHTDQFAEARGLCAACYQTWLRKGEDRPRAPCHPERAEYAKGLCNPCYQAERTLLADGQRQKRADAERKRREAGLVKAVYKVTPPKPYSNSGRWRRMGVIGYPKDGIVPKVPCEICGLDRQPNLDHDHATGQFRGWLCQPCNTGIGHFADSIERLEKAILYLRKSK